MFPFFFFYECSALYSVWMVDVPHSKPIASCLCVFLLQAGLNPNRVVQCVYMCVYDSAVRFACSRGRLPSLWKSLGCLTSAVFSPVQLVRHEILIQTQLDAKNSPSFSLPRFSEDKRRDFVGTPTPLQRIRPSLLAMLLCK